MKSKTVTFLSGIAMLAFLSTPIRPVTYAQEQQSRPDTGTRNPVPLINQPLVPDVATPGGAGFTLTVNGAGFVYGSRIVWNRSLRPTTFFSDRRLTTTIRAEDIKSAGTVSVSVVNPGPGGGRSNTTFFPITKHTFSVNFAESHYNVGPVPIQVAVGDFNGDGNLDVAAVNFNCVFGFVCAEPGWVSILLGNGNGTFQQGGSFTVGFGPVFAAVGDFNRDGKLDLAVPNIADNTISVLLGNGDGTFQPATAYAVGLSPTAAAVGDFNSDGKLDLAINNNGSNTVSILLGNGNGTFQAQTEYATASTPQGVTVGDFNEDGKLDLAVNDIPCVEFPACGPGMVSILLGNGDGTFQTHVDYPTGSTPDSVTAADFNGDGILDLVTANGTYDTNNTVSVLLGNGDGTFQPNVDYTAGNGPAFVALGDYNGDGKIDMAVANSGSNVVSVFLGNGNGTFRPPIYFAGGAGANGIAAGDFNDDGKLDLAVGDLTSTSTTVFILLQ